MQKSSSLPGQCGREATETKIYHENGLTKYVVCLLDIRAAGRVSVRMAYSIKYTRPAVVFPPVFPSNNGGILQRYREQDIRLLFVDERIGMEAYRKSTNIHLQKRQLTIMKFA